MGTGYEQGAGGVGGLLAIYDPSTVNNQPSTHFCAYDGNGNVAALMNAMNGLIAAQYEYGPFGEVIRATGPMAKANPFRFSTKYQDDETDLLYYGYRYYNPSTGRWPNRDPLQEKGGANLYGFVGNNPCSLVDSLGLDIGTVSVYENHAMGGLSIGWVIKMRWTPPQSWKGQKANCLPCKKVVWVQDRKYDIEFYWWARALGNKDIHTGWGKDWDETDYNYFSVAWLPGNPDSTMSDEPTPGSFLQQSKVKSVFFSANAKVKCIDGPDAGKIYATVEWGYFDFVSGGVESSGGGLGY